MRRTVTAAITAAITAALIIGQAATGLGFLDELFSPPPKKKSGEGARQSEQTERKPEQKGLLEGLGGIFGAKEKDVDLIKKGLKTVQSLQPIGLEEEIAIGQAVAVEAFSRFGGEYPHEGLTRYVSLVGKTVADVSDRPELLYHFAVLNSREVNAFAAPGGYVFVTRGLLETLENEAQLAGVLAHEVAHVTQRHMLDTIRRGAILANVSEFSLSAMDKDPALFSNVIDQVTEMLFEKGLDKELEFEADVHGIAYAYRAGYNPGGLRAYLRALQRQEGRAVSRLFSTHPSTAERLQRVDETLQAYRDGAGYPYLAERFQTSRKR